jgi:hypothetical protein
MRQRLRRALHHIHLPFRRKAKEKSTLDSNEPPVDASHGSHEPSNNYKSEPRHSIWGRQLRQGQIRLFKMELDWNDDIRGTLEVFEHKTAPEYFAQSYVCGEGGCHSKIVVNGSAHYIKANLYVALLQTKRALRKSRETSSSPSRTAWLWWLWIDAICVDQENVTELAMQIRFMEHIYRDAKITFVSLGLWTEPHRLISHFNEWATADEEISRLQEMGENRATDDS